MVAGAAQAFERHLVAGGELLRESRVGEACREFEAALAVRPNDHKALGLLGLAHFRRNAFADALPVYEQLVIIAPDDASYRLNLGLVHLKLGDAGKAIEQLAASRDLDPGQSRTVSYLGLAYARAGEYAKAFEAFLQGGQSELASEMEQHLSDREKMAIIARVSSAKDSRSDLVVDEIGAAVDALQESDEPAVEVSPDDVEEVSPDDVESESDIAEDTRAAPKVVAAAPPPGPPPPAPPPTPQPPVLESPEPEPEEIEADEIISAEPAAPSKTSRSAVSQMVRIAAPSSAAETAAKKTAVGHHAPGSLSQFATERLVRPDDGDHALELSKSGLLIVRVTDRILSRRDGVIVSSGILEYEAAHRRVRGANLEEPLGGAEHPIFVVTGSGQLVVSPGDGQFAALILADDILYLREDFVFAFEEELHWESGHVPGSGGTIDVIQFRGEGALAIRFEQELISVKLAGERVLRVAPEALAGWIGRVIPRVAKQPAEEGGGTLVECSGEGIVLITGERSS